MELSIEQSLTLESFKRDVAKMSHTQAQDFAIKIFELMLARETVYKRMQHDDFNMANVAFSAKDYQ